MTAQEAIQVLAMYDSTVGDSPGSPAYNETINQAMKLLALETGIPLWWFAERGEYTGKETVSALRFEWEEWQDWES